MIEAGSKVNWAALESGVVDKIFFYYAPKILGGLQSLPVAGGIGRRRRADAIRIHDGTVHSIPPDEFAVEGYMKEGAECSPGLSKKWAPWGVGRPAGARLEGPLPVGPGGHDGGRQHRGQRRLPDRGRLATGSSRPTWRRRPRRTNLGALRTARS